MMFIGRHKKERAGWEAKFIIRLSELSVDLDALANKINRIEAAVQKICPHKKTELSENYGNVFAFPTFKETCSICGATIRITSDRKEYEKRKGEQEIKEHEKEIERIVKSIFNRVKYEKGD